MPYASAIIDHLLNLSPPLKFAVLSIDEHEFVAKEGSSALTTLAQKEVLDFAKNAGAPIVVTQFGEEQLGNEVLSVPCQTDKTPDWLKSILLDYSNTYYLEKFRFNAFSGTNLDDFLREKQITHLVIMGGDVDSCVRATITGSKETLGDENNDDGAIQRDYEIVTGNVLLRSSQDGRYPIHDLELPDLVTQLSDIDRQKIFYNMNFAVNPLDLFVLPLYFY